MTIDFYQLPFSTPCRAVLMGIRQLNLSANLIPLNIMEGEHMKEKFLKLNPSHCIPTIVDGGFSLWESRAILQYLVNQYASDSSLYPSEPKKRAVIDRLLNFDLGSLSAATSKYFYPQAMRGEAPNEDDEKAMKVKFQLLDDLLGKSKYVAGNVLTIADFSILATVTILDGIDYDYESTYANIKAWKQRLQEELPFYAETVTEPIVSLRGWVHANKAKKA